VLSGFQVLAGFIGGARARSACFKRDRAAAKGPIAHPPWLGKLFAISPVSAEAIVYLASSPEAGTTTGQYYYKCLRTVGAGTGRPICLLLWQRQRAIGRHEGKWCAAALTPSSRESSCPHFQPNADLSGIVFYEVNAGLLKRFLYFDDGRELSFLNAFVSFNALQGRQA
jgi:hypothetical protein